VVKSEIENFKNCKLLTVLLNQELKLNTKNAVETATTLAKRQTGDAMVLTINGKQQ